MQCYKNLKKTKTKKKLETFETNSIMYCTSTVFPAGSRLGIASQSEKLCTARGHMVELQQLPVAAHCLSLTSHDGLEHQCCCAWRRYRTDAKQRLFSDLWCYRHWRIFYKPAGLAERQSRNVVMWFGLQLFEDGPFKMRYPLSLISNTHIK